MIVKLIGAAVALPLRAKILRPNQPSQVAIYENDNSPETFHVGAFENNVLLGVATFYPEEYSGIPGKQAYRLRGMAVESFAQGKGYGKAVLVFGENLVKEKAEILWFNAREIAFPFYQNLGYEFASPMFEIPNIGPHKVMIKYFDLK